jgi:hypothetical protein
MSCLYSSPEVTSLEVKHPEFSVSLSLRPMRLASWAPRRYGRHGGAVRFHSNFAICRGQQKRVPQQLGSTLPGCTKSFCLPKQAQVCRVSFQAQ